MYKRIRNRYNTIYEKLCTLDREKLPACCVHTQRNNTVDNELSSLCGDKNEVIGTYVLNNNLCEILELSCNTIPDDIGDIHDMNDMSSTDDSVILDHINHIS